MATMIEARPTVKPAGARTLDVILAVSVNGVGYTVSQTDPGESGTKAYRLSKLAGDRAVYDVVRDEYGLVVCTCADYEWRHRGRDAGMCKHGQALVLVGLLDAPTPIVRSKVGSTRRDEPTPDDRKAWAAISNRTTRDYSVVGESSPPTGRYPRRPVPRPIPGMDRRPSGLTDEDVYPHGHC
jgi:hypothetical protein